jgi:hypothetical protein
MIGKLNSVAYFIHPAEFLSLQQWFSFSYFSFVFFILIFITIYTSLDHHISTAINIANIPGLVIAPHPNPYSTNSPQSGPKSNPQVDTWFGLHSIVRRLPWA